MDNIACDGMDINFNLNEAVGLYINPCKEKRRGFLAGTAAVLFCPARSDFASSFKGLKKPCKISDEDYNFTVVSCVF